MILARWPKFETVKKFNKNHDNINKVIDLISNVRSTKAELKITPKLYCNISFPEKSGKLKKLTKNNLNLIKKLEELTISSKKHKRKKIL